MRPNTLLALLSLMVCLPWSVAAQWRIPALGPPSTWRAAAASLTPDSQLSRFEAQTEQDSRRGQMIGGGLLGGAVGAAVGWALAVKQGGDVGSVFGGAVLGASAGIPIGVHIANGRRGDLGIAELASVAWGAALFSAAAEGNSLPLLAAAPAGSLVISVYVETRTSQ